MASETVGERVQTIVDSAMEGLAEAFEKEPTMTFTGGEIARMIRTTAIRRSIAVRDGLGVPVREEEGRPE